MRIFALLCLFGTSLAFAADPQTGEPIPALQPGSPPAPEQVATQTRDDLTLLAHIADGTTKEVRALGGGYVAFQNGAWLEFYDVSDPLAPARAARILLQAQPSDLKVDGTMLYASLRKTEGLLAVDISDPAAPVVVGQREGYDMLSVDTGNGLAYCGVGSAGVVMVNLADLTVAGNFATTGSANGTAIAGTTLYVARGVNGLGIYNVTNPSAVTLLGTYATPSFCTFVQVRGNYAYLAGNFGLMIVDVTNPAAPVLRGTLSVGDATYEMSFVGDELYLAGLTGGYRLDVSDPTAPRVLAQTGVANSFSIAVEGSTAFLAERYMGLRVLSAAQLQPLLLIPTAGFSNRLHLQGNFLHVVDLGGGVRIWDLSDPAHPALASDTNTPANSQDLALAGNLSFVVNSSNAGSGLWTLDVSNPASPVVLSTYNTGGAAYGVEAQDDRLYVANGNSGLLVLNVANPASPSSLGSLPTTSQAFDVRVQGTIAYVATFGAGLASIQASNPGFMSILDQEAGWGFLNALEVTDGYAWVAAQTGLRVVDITNPTNLTSVFFGGFGGQPRDVAIGADLYLADDMYGLRQVDISNPASPSLTASFPSADRGMGVDAQGDLVVLAAGEAGVYVYQSSGGATDVDVARLGSAQLQAVPNPFNPQLEIRWELPKAANLSIAIHDARGHLVRSFELGSRPAGSGSVVWNGTDTAGRACASGTYVLRLQAGATSETRTVTLVK